MENYVGKRLDGRYEMQEIIGIGGMAVVYKAYDRIDDRIVSIKVLKEEFLGNEEFMRRFRNESRAIAILSHPNIVKVYDVSFGDRLQYIVMEYIDGITLKEYIEQQKQLSWKEAVHFTLQILSALRHAHEKGIVHRDIKPQNIMLLKDGTVKVTDFGIARFANSETRTMTDKAIGSVHYIAPEQARGSITDEKADIYSVGVMLFEMLTGKLPFEAENAVSVAIMQLQSEPRHPRDINPSIPEGLEEIVLKAMKKEPSQRYSSAAEMIEDIRKFQNNPSIRFQYQYFVDEKPTRYMDAIDHVKSQQHNEIAGEEAEPSTERAARVSAIPIITGVAVAFVLFVIVFGTILFLRNLPVEERAEDIFLPDYVGRLYEEVQKEDGDKFNFIVLHTTDNSAPSGQIMKQEPKGGVKEVKQGSDVRLTVNDGAVYTNVPKVTGLDLAQAISNLSANDLRYEQVEVFDDETASGYVVGVSPAENEQIAKNDTVTLYVSKGAQSTTVIVDNYVNKTFEEAKRMILEKGFKVGQPKVQDSDQPKNTVIGQSPEYGSALNKGETVTLTISSGTPPPPEESTLEIELTLPDVNSDLSIAVYVNGIKDESQSRQVNPALSNRKYKLSFAGTGKKEVVVQLDGQSFEKYELNFDDGSANLLSHTDYKPPVSSAPAEPASSAPSSVPAGTSSGD